MKFSWSSLIGLLCWSYACFAVGVVSSPLQKVSTGHDTSGADLYRVTAYCPGECCCGKWADGITASGRRATGLIVAAPPNIPFGTVLDIPGYGWASVEDRGGAIKGMRLDVLFPTHQEALNWGVQYLDVTVK